MEPPHWTAHADRAIKLLGRARAFARINMLLSFALLVYLLLETLFFSQPTALRAFNLLLAFLAIKPSSHLSSIADVPTENALPEKQFAVVCMWYTVPELEMNHTRRWKQWGSQSCSG
jgi:hypothetical protein